MLKKKPVNWTGKKGDPPKDLKVLVEELKNSICERITNIENDIIIMKEQLSKLEIKKTVPKLPSDDSNMADFHEAMEKVYEDQKFDII